MVTASYVSIKDTACKFAAWMFFMRGLAYSTIKTYIAAVSFTLFVNNLSPGSLWHLKLNKIVKGIERNCASEKPIFNRTKLPFTRAMIALALVNVLDNGSIFELRAIHAALCMGLMFLFRKSEFLTNSQGVGKYVDGKPVTLLADDVFFWYGDVSYCATNPLLPIDAPEFLSMFLPHSKSDQMGKGATRFFPADPNCATCLVKIIHEYVLEANLSTGDHLFAGPKFIVSSDMVANTIKATAQSIGLPPDRLSNHSLRIGGLVSLFAANVSDDLKKLAGRWSSERSFIAYARATMQQFSTIASVLNNISLVTPDHIKRFYA